MPEIKASKPVRAVAIFEAVKGFTVLLTGFGALTFIHHNIQQAAEQFVGQLHLNPAKHYPRIFLDAAADLTDSRLIAFALLAIVYAAVRIVEAFGLWHEKRWAEWIAAISGGIYIPFELYELSKDPSLLVFLIMMTNLLIVALMVIALRRSAENKSVRNR